VESQLITEVAKQGLLGLLLALSLFTNYKLLRFIITKLLLVVEQTATNAEKVAEALRRASDDG
tara:strand:- start:179 stop:367 length:189 start_codon:yes stop_codon:yes gene_type:complete